jgi:hypothetical protein
MGTVDDYLADLPDDVVIALVDVRLAQVRG